MSTFERAAVAGAALYLIVLGVAMQTITYDIWGALVVAPVLVVISVPLVKRAFSGELEPLRSSAWLGMFVKFAGAYAGYRVRFESYGGQADSNRYHDVGRQLAGAVRNGSASLSTVIPTGQKTQFIEQSTGLVYTVFGSSRLGGFMVFTWMSYWGLVLFAKAAMVAVPALAKQRYLLLLCLFPSLVYWGSSIGKEAVIGLLLGACAYGFALILAMPRHRLFGLLLSAASLLVVSRIRVHLAVIWLGGVVIALVGRAVLDLTRRNDHGRRQFRFSTIALTFVAVIGFVAVATAALNFLAPASEDEAVTETVTDRVSSIFETVGDRTSEGGSTFTPISTSSPANWPYAAFRTLTRPFLTEARGLAGLLPALEMTALLVAAVVSWRRLLHAPKLLLTTPYLVFALIAIFTFGVTFASIGNLGILVRQRSLIMPLFLLFWCLPPIPPPAVAPAPQPGAVDERRGYGALVSLPRRVG